MTYKREGQDWNIRDLLFFILGIYIIIILYLIIAWKQSAAPIIFIIWFQMGGVKDNLDKSRCFQFVGKSLFFWKKKIDWICLKMFYARIFCRAEALKRRWNWQPGYMHFCKDMGFTGLQQRFHKVPGFRANHPGRLAQERGPHISTGSGFKCCPASQPKQLQRSLTGAASGLTHPISFF